MSKVILSQEIREECDRVIGILAQAKRGMSSAGAGETIGGIRNFVRFARTVLSDEMTFKKLKGGKGFLIVKTHHRRRTIKGVRP